MHAKVSQWRRKWNNRKQFTKNKGKKAGINENNRSDKQKHQQGKNKANYTIIYRKQKWNKHSS